MRVDLSAASCGDKVIMRDGSKVTLNEYNGELRVILQELKSWERDGTWSRFNPNCHLDIVGIIHSHTAKEHTNGQQ